MKKITFLFALFLFIGLFAQKQPDLSKYKSIDKKLKVWEAHCKSLTEVENYSQLIHDAQIGISLSKNFPKYLTKFYFYTGYGYEYTDNNYKKATVYFEKSLYLAQKHKDLYQETVALMRLNYMYYSIKEHEKGKNLISYIKKVVDTVRDKNSKAILLGSLGEYYLDRSEFENFINYKLKAIDYLLLDKNRDDLKNNNIGVSYLQIADAYNDMKQYEKAVEYCNYALPFLNKSDGIAFLYNSLIEAYTNLNKIDLAKKNYNNLYRAAKNNPMLFLNLSYANRNMAEFYLNNKDLISAEDYADKALLFAQKSKDEEIEMEANVIKGKVLLEQKKYPEAIKKLNLALNFAYVYDKRSFAEINQKLSESYAALQEWEKAYEYFKIYNQTNDSLYIESGKQSIANAEAKYQNRNKGQEIKALSAENTIHELTIRNAKKQRIYLISGLISIAIIGGMLYYQSQNRKKNNLKLSLLNSELEKANRNKMRFFGILNHDLRSPVASLVHFLHLQKEAPELMDQETKNRINNQTTQSAEQLLTQMEDLLLWSKSQMEKFEPHPKKFSSGELFSELKNEFIWANSIEFFYEYPQDQKIFSDKEFLKTILRNLIGNAIKVLQEKENGKIWCTSSESQDFIKISVKDNGGGAHIEKFKALYSDQESIGIKNGLGLHVIRELCKAIDVEIQVQSSVKEGETEISLYIKKT